MSVRWNIGVNPVQLDYLHHSNWKNGLFPLSHEARFFSCNKLKFINLNLSLLSLFLFSYFFTNWNKQEYVSEF